MASKLNILGILGLLVVFAAASYDYSNILSFGSLDQELHHRSKRAIPYPSSPENPTNVTFYLHKLGAHENVTSMSVGSHIRFQLIIHFPVGTTDMLVELFTPDNATTIMKLCHPEVTHLGNKLSVNVNNVVQDMATINKNIKKEGKTPTTKDYDRAVIELGNVTASAATSNTPTEAMIQIEWEAIMIENAATVNGAAYWVSAGAEYNQDTEVWVGQASITAVIDNWTPPMNPAANLTGPDTMQIGSSAAFKVDMYIPYPSVALTFDAFAPLNHSGVMSVCSVAITSTGKNYDCLEKEKNFTTYPSSSGKGNERGRLVIGTVTNKDARQSILLDGRITVEFVMYLFDNATSVGNTFWVGAAVEIGTSKIWAGQLQVQAVARLTNDTMTTDPSFASFINGSSTVGVGDTVVMGVNMTVPDNQPGQYDFEVLAPYNISSPQMRICKVLAVFNGANIPCLSDSNAVYLARDNNTLRADQAKWDLGKITNFGHFTESTTYPTPDVVTFSVALEVLDHSYNTPGASSWITAGMTFTKQKLWLGQTSVTIGGAPTNASSTAPTFNMFFKNSSDQLWINESGLAILEISTAAHSVYHPMDMEFIMPFENNSAMMTICKVEIIYVGGNFPCFNQAKFNSSFNLTSKASDPKKPDKALISLGQLSNVGFSNDPKENKIIFAIYFKVQDHVGLTEGAKRFVSVGVMYGPITIWVGQLQVTAKRAGAPTAAAPYIDALRADDPGHMNLPIGGIVVYDLMIKMQPASSSKIIIAATGSANLKVCLVKLMEIGTNLPCVRDDLNATVSGTTTTLDLGIVTNLADEQVVTNNTFDNNTLRVRVIAQLDFQTGVTVGSSHTLTLNVDNGATAGWTNPTPSVFTATAAAPVNSTNATNPSFSFNVYSPEGDGMTLTNNKVAKGETKLYRLDITPQDQTVNRIQVKFLTPVNTTGELEICAVNVLHVGLNMPCNKREVYNGTGTFQSRYNSPFKDIAGIDLGYICYHQLYNESEEQKITVEAVAKLLPNSSMTAGQEFYLSATVMINDDQIYVTQIKMTVLANSDFNSTAVNSSLGGLKVVEAADVLLTWRPGSLYTVQFTLAVPPNSSTMASVQVSTPMPTTAVMTIKNFKIVSAGVNIGCILANRTEGEYPMTLNSTVQSTQLDRGYISLGILTNSGVSFRVNSYTPEDDKITLEVECQMADAPINTANSVHKLSFGARLGKVLYLMDKNVAVTRDGNEQPELQLNVTSNETITYDEGTPIVIDALLYHEATSSAEAHDVSVTFFYPKILKFAGIVYCNHTTPTTEEITVPGNGISINFTRILFTDAANFSIKLVVDASASLPASLGATPDAITPYEAASTKIGRTVDSFAAGYVFVTRMDSLSYKVQLPAGGGCGMNPLGLEDKRIQDCQLDSSYTPSATPSQLRMGQTGYWTSAVRGGHIDKSVVINFGNITRVNSIALEHPGANSRITQYRVQYSNDGVKYTDGELVIPTANYGTSVNNLTSPQEARFMRVVFLDNAGGADGTVSVRLEAYGCTTLGDVSITDVCKTKPWETLSTATDFVTRGFLATTTTLYYCDAVSDEKTLKCFSSADAATWKSIDPVVINVIGYSTIKDELYGIAKDKRTYLVSGDSGATWYSMSKARFNKMQAETGFVAHAAAGWVKDATVSDPPSAGLTKGTWAAGYKGLYKSGSVVADWTKCCAP